MVQNPELPLHRNFSAAGSAWRLRSNCAAVLQAAADTFPIRGDCGLVDLNVEIYIDAESAALPRWEIPQFRGRDHLVFADYGPGDSMLADLQARQVIGRFSFATAQDTGYWKRVIFPILLGITAAPLGVTALHCACLQYKGEGLLITGESGAGKSTLSLELARRGLDFISDDWTYFSRRDSEVLGWGLPTKIKLLPDSVAHFPELRAHIPVMHLNGELAFEIDPQECGSRYALYCRPGRIFLLDRQPGAGFEVLRLTANEIAGYFERTLERLPGCLAEYRDTQLATIRALCRAESWYVRCGGTPQEIATRILRFCEQEPSAPILTSLPLPVTRREWPDMLRRFTPLPHQQPLSYRGRSVQVATNSERVTRALRSLKECRAVSCQNGIGWTVQEEPDWPAHKHPAQGLSIGALSFLRLGGHSFAACDRSLGRAITFTAATHTDTELQKILQKVLSWLLREEAPAVLPASTALGVPSNHADATP
jgi:HPr serine kinase-like protein